MEARHLDLLRELADRGSVTAVAEATRRTPSAVSQQLKTAQRELGVRLVEPSGRGLRLTPAGAVLAAAGRDVSAALERAQAQWDEFQGVATGLVAIAALPSAATFLLPGVFDELADEPIALQCNDFDIAEVEWGGLVNDHDIVIAHSMTSRAPAGTKGLKTVRLVREPLDIAMAADHPLARRREVTAAEVAGEEWVGVPIGYPFDRVLQSIARETGATLRISQRLRDNRLIESLVASGHRLAVLPRFTTPQTGEVVLRPLRDIPTGRHVFAVLRPDKAERFVVRRVLEAFVDVASRRAQPLVE
ncbi:LysR family transcriptional regulator [Luteipulveratus mongoliensis]|uniref:HTH lysR-type domain-containing protein n=1 Tax=Luteipulveratus mongoliensis TaxID=571913 RepID=A0A0K1JEB9_9MICO|nr:LysR family transcriptional regulator [Luteipulveratus mongoliensis]AKU14935.1 hypothetical protein VV02_02065 [Luteipulveratus mongoliensis]